MSGSGAFAYTIGNKTYLVVADVDYAGSHRELEDLAVTTIVSQDGNGDWADDWEPWEIYGEHAEDFAALGVNSEEDFDRFIKDRAETAFLSGEMEMDEDREREWREREDPEPDPYYAEDMGYMHEVRGYSI